MEHSLSRRLLARFFAVLLFTSGTVSALVHPLPNLTDMTGWQRMAITAVCIVFGVAIWIAPWDRWPRRALFLLPPIGIGVKLWANLLGGLGPYSYSIHFVLVYVWMGIALPRGAPLAFSPLLAAAYALPLAIRGDPKQIASLAMVLPICVVIGESVAWISNRLRQAEEQVRYRLARLQWLLEKTTELARLSGRDRTVERLAELAAEIPGVRGAAVLLAVDARELERAATAGWPGELPERIDRGAHPALVEAIRSREVVLHDDPRSVAFAKWLGVASIGCAPLFGSGRCTGMVLLAHDANAAPVDAFDREMFRILRVQAGLAIERMRDRELLRTRSLHDPLTGLGNRRKADERLARLEPGDALLLLDLDWFKRVNDQLGHPAGDEVLRSLGSFLSESLREDDEAYRIGGEEFLCVLSAAGYGAEAAAERLVESWRLLDPVTTWSGGIAVHPLTDPPTSPETTLARADEALYAAKEAGRDRVHMATVAAWDAGRPERSTSDGSGSSG